MAAPLYVLAVLLGEASALPKGRQLSRLCPPDPKVMDGWVAILGVPHQEGGKQSIVSVGKLTGAGYYPGFCRDPEFHMGKAYKRKTGQPGPWVWVFSNVVDVVPIPHPPLEERRHAVEFGDRRWYCVDEGRGDAWSCCARKLDSDTVERVREARRKAKER